MARAGRAVQASSDVAELEQGESGQTNADAVFNQQVFLIHGDKGGVGKSFFHHTFVDRALAGGVPMAVIEADTRNPDAIRVFEGLTDCQTINLRRDDGWMDVIDFIKQHPRQHVAVSLPAGIGESMKKEFTDFCRFLKTKVPGAKIVLVWLINLFPDSVNLLYETWREIGEHVSKVVVVRNLIFGGEDQFFVWNESPLKADLEGRGVLTTVSLPALHLRVTTKLFADPESAMPMTQAAANPGAFSFLPSEQFKLENYVNHDLREPLDWVCKFVGL
ncbi:hypothetical protein [Burkholderia sp. LMG 13014]|uniref:hypothetical protein n=1 Tax=Burkholderia sp. LMG 13014 TaxID=2709306 RepID=UPI001962E427|nr:hypothetical protein [Burkholderia sp. LMG 13014]